jgi:SAM-dependent methyltransferase
MADDSPGLEQEACSMYRNRFPAAVLQRRKDVWRVLCTDWFARYIPPQARVLEVAGGYCEFINNVSAAEKAVVDLNPDTREHADAGVTVQIASAETVGDVFAASHFDVAFTSNFFEHCRSREQVLAVLRAVRTVLKPGGRFLIMGPNFRYCYKDYFDFFDHHLALTDLSMCEALALAGYAIETVQPQSLPFSFKSGLPAWPWLVGLYLKMPFAWRLFGKQFFIVASVEPSKS